jgi:putative transposase
VSRRFVFVTKYRRDVLDGEMLTACEQVMRGLCTQMGAELREFNGETDHVHVLVHYPPRLPVSTLVNRLKGVSAHYLRKQFTGRVSRHLMHGHLWSPSYFAASCGGAPLETSSSTSNSRSDPLRSEPMRFLPALN